MLNEPYTITNSHPAFLKTAYLYDLNLIDHVRHVPSGAKYISWEMNRGWRVWRMTKERVPIPLGVFNNPGCALYVARK